MRCSLNLLAAATILAIGIAALAQSPTYRLGKPATEEEIRAWDIAVGPSGKELPPGSGTATEGAKVYTQKCAVCHGPTGKEGHKGPPFEVPRLVGGRVGTFWPFATTIWDYINRGMPRNQPGTLSADEVYSVTAFLLYKNGIIQESDVLDAKTLPKVRMPNRDGFVPAEPGWKPGMKRPFRYYP